MDNIGVLEASDDMYDGVAFADICKELISESFTLGRALDQSCDIDELDRCRCHFLRMAEVSKKLEPFIRNRHDSDIGIYCAERIVGRFCACLGE